MRQLHGITVAAILVALATPARGGDPKHGASSGMGAGSTAMHEHMRKAGREMQQMPMTGDVDHDFVTAMRKHHQDGIKMAQMALASGKDPEARELAQRIIEKQQRDLRDFDAWLARNKPTAAGRDASTGTGAGAPDSGGRTDQEPGESPSAGTSSKGSRHGGASPSGK